MLCREVYQKAGMKQLHTDGCVFTRYVCNIIGPSSSTNEDLLVNGKFFNMEIVPMQMRVYRSCSHPVPVMILVMYVDNNEFCYNLSWYKNLRSLSSKMVALICNVKESSIGFLLVCYTYDKITDAVGCIQQPYIDCLLVKYGMERANACSLPMNPSSNLESLPILDTPDKIVVRAYVALIGKLLFIAINTIPQLSYSMSCLICKNVGICQ